jgi:hypothetical protein
MGAIIVRGSSPMTKKEFRRTLNPHIDMLSRRVAAIERHVKKSIQRISKIVTDIGTVIDDHHKLLHEKDSFLPLRRDLNAHPLEIPAQVNGDWGTRKAFFGEQLTTVIQSDQRASGIYQLLTDGEFELGWDAAEPMIRQTLQHAERIQGQDPTLWDHLLLVMKAKFHIDRNDDLPGLNWETVYKAHYVLSKDHDLMARVIATVNDSSNKCHEFNRRIVDEFNRLYETDLLQQLRHSVGLFVEEVNSAHPFLQIGIDEDLALARAAEMSSSLFSRQLLVLSGASIDLNRLQQKLSSYDQERHFESISSELIDQGQGILRQRLELSAPERGRYSQEISEQSRIELLDDESAASPRTRPLSVAPSPLLELPDPSSLQPEPLLAEDPDSDADYNFKRAFDAFRTRGLPKFRALMAAAKKLSGHPLTFDFYTEVIDILRQKGHMMDHSNVHSPDGLRMQRQINFRHAIQKKPRTSLFTDYKTFLAALDRALSEYDASYAGKPVKDGDTRVVEFHSQRPINGVLYTGNPPRFEDNKETTLINAVFKISFGQPVLLTIYPDFDADHLRG